MKLPQIIVKIATPIVWLLLPFRTRNKQAVIEAIGDKKCIICCNHTSFMDPAYLLMSYPKYIYFMAKAELFESKLAAWFLGTVMKSFPVSRGTGDTHAIDTARSILDSGHVLGIFPEGTRSKTGELGRGKSGAALLAAQTGAHILPICLVPKRKKRVSFFHMTTVVYGQPISPEELHLDGEHPDLRYATRKIMAAIGELREQV